MNGSLLSSDGEEDPPDKDDDLYNWEYYTENFDTLEEEKVASSSSSLRTHSGLYTAAKYDNALGGSDISVNDVTQAISSSDVTFSPSHQAMDYYARAIAASTVPSMTRTDETQERMLPLRSTATNDFSMSGRTASEQGLATPKNGHKSVFDFSGDDSLSPLPLQSTNMRRSPNHYHSSTVTMPTAPAIFRPIYGDLVVPSSTFASLHEHGEAATSFSFAEKCIKQNPTVTHRTDSPLSLVRPQTQLCKPLTGYNYFYRDEKDNILRHLQQPGDPLPDPVCDFSAHKMEQLLHEHWCVFRHCTAIYGTPSSQQAHLRFAGTSTLRKERDHTKRVTGRSRFKSKLHLSLLMSVIASRVHQFSPAYSSWRHIRAGTDCPKSLHSGGSSYRNLVDNFIAKWRVSTMKSTKSICETDHHFHNIAIENDFDLER
jgi:hypothetical protein